MTARDKPDYERRRQQIIDGALTVFAAKGFEKATNQEIARAAGIGSPGLIYHYFENKTDLLHQAVISRSTTLRSVVNDDALMDMAPHAALRLVASVFLTTLNDPTNLSVFRVIVGEAARNPGIAAAWHAHGFLPVFGGLVRYFSAQMQAGKLRRIDPITAAACFMGPFFLFLMSREILRQPDMRAMDQDNMVDAAVEVFLQGLEPT